MTTTKGKLHTIGDLEILVFHTPQLVRGALVEIDDVDALRRLAPLLAEGVAIVPAKWADAIDAAAAVHLEVVPGASLSPDARLIRRGSGFEIAATLTLDEAMSAAPIDALEAQLAEARGDEPVSDIGLQAYRLHTIHAPDGALLDAVPEVMGVLRYGDCTVPSKLVPLLVLAQSAAPGGQLPEPITIGGEPAVLRRREDGTIEATLSDTGRVMRQWRPFMGEFGDGGVR